MGWNETTLQGIILSLLKHEEQFAATVYHHLFTMYPQTKVLFAHTDMSMQYSKLLLTLSIIARALRDPKSLALRLHELGRRHTYYHLNPEHYTHFGNALLKTFAQYMDTQWTPELEALWMQTYQSIVQMMCSALPAGESPSTLVWSTRSDF
jgi:hemoglobin-like flavoprotein